MRKGFVYLLMAAVALISLGTLNSCKDYEDDLRQETRINAALQDSTLRGLLTQLRGDCNYRIDSLRDAFNTCSLLCESERVRMDGRIDSLATETKILDNLLKTKADSVWVQLLEDRVNTLGDSIYHHETRIALLETAKEAIEKTIDTLKAEVLRIDTLEWNLDALEKRVTAAEGRLDGVDVDIDTLYTRLTRIQTDIILVQKDMEKLREFLVKYIDDKYEEFNNRVNDLKDYILAYQQAQQAMVEQQNTIYKELLDQQKAYYDNALQLYNDLVNGKYDQLLQAQEIWEQALELKYDALGNKYDALSDKVDLYKAYVDALKDAVNSYSGKVDQFIQSYVDNFSQLQNAMATINGTIASLSETVGTLKGDLIVTTSKAIEALQRATNDSIMIKELEKVVESVQQKMKTDSLNTNYRIDTLSNYADRISEALKDAQKNYDAAIELLKERDIELGNDIVTLTTSIADLNTACQAADEAIKSDIEKLDGQVDKNTKAIDKLEDDLTALTTRVKNLENAHETLITGIEIQQTVNPVFGTFHFPADMRSTILFGYYGKSTRAGNFPSYYEQGCYVSDAFALSKDEYDRLVDMGSDSYSYKSGDILINGGDKLNIGTLYLTVNPTKADLTGTEFSLENSKGVAAKATLSDLTASDYLVDFGYTRSVLSGAASSRGFYEATASIAKSDVVGAALHVDGLKSAVKQVIDKAKGINIDVDVKKGTISYTNSSELNISEVVETILDNVSGVTDAYAVKATWNDAVVGERSVYSQYGLAATAMQNICGYSSFIDFNYKTVPGYEKAISFIDKVAASLKKQINSYWKKMDDLSMPTIEYITYERPSSTDDRFKINIAIKYNAESGYVYTPGQKGYLNICDKSGNVVGRIPFGDVTVEGSKVVLTVYDKDIDTYPALKSIFDAIDMILYGKEGYTGKPEDAPGGINKTYEDLQDLLDQVNSILNTFNDVKDKVNNSIDKYSTQLQKLLTSLNNKLVSFVNASNVRLQPIIISTSDSETRILGFSKDQPRAVSSSSQLIMTNMLGEVVAPALKKHIACTNVYKDGKDAQYVECYSLMQDFNKLPNVNKVLDGSTTRVDISGLKPGYTYEIALSCLDYEGMQSTRKQYIIVK